MKRCSRCCSSPAVPVVHPRRRHCRHLRQVFGEFGRAFPPCPAAGGAVGSVVERRRQKNLRVRWEKVATTYFRRQRMDKRTRRTPRNLRWQTRPELTTDKELAYLAKVKRNRGLSLNRLLRCPYSYTTDLTKRSAIARHPRTGYHPRRVAPTNYRPPRPSKDAISPWPPAHGRGRCPSTRPRRRLRRWQNRSAFDCC